MRLDLSHTKLSTEIIPSFLDLAPLKSPFDHTHGDNIFGKFCNYILEHAKDIDGIRTTGIQRRIWMLMQEVGSKEPTQEQIDKVDGFAELVTNLKQRRLDWLYLDYLEGVIGCLHVPVDRWRLEILRLRIAIENDRIFDEDAINLLAYDIDNWIHTKYGNDMPPALSKRLDRLRSAATKPR